MTDPKVIIHKGVDLYTGYMVAQQFLKERAVGHGMGSLIGYSLANGSFVVAYRTKSGTIIVKTSK